MTKRIRRWWESESQWIITDGKYSHLKRDVKHVRCLARVTLSSMFYSHYLQDLTCNRWFVLETVSTCREKFKMRIQFSHVALPICHRNFLACNASHFPSRLSARNRTTEHGQGTPHAHNNHFKKKKKTSKKFTKLFSKFGKILRNPFKRAKVY